jgi:hypothetical protein
MRRSTLRFFAFAVLAFLSAPVAMHVVMHDLHDHHDEIAIAIVPGADHGNHEHPVVSSYAPKIPAVPRVALPVAIPLVVTPATWIRVTTADRNVVSFGAMRMDDDIGLHALHATFLI